MNIIQPFKIKNIEHALTLYWSLEFSEQHSCYNTDRRVDEALCLYSLRPVT